MRYATMRQYLQRQQSASAPDLSRQPLNSTTSSEESESTTREGNGQGKLTSNVCFPIFDLDLICVTRRISSGASVCEMATFHLT